MKRKVTPQTFEFSRTGMVRKDEIDEDREYLLCIMTKSQTHAWEVDIQVWYDSPVGNAFVEIENPKSDMILLSKNNYGKDWYLLR